MILNCKFIAIKNEKESEEKTIVLAKRLGNCINFMQ